MNSFEEAGDVRDATIQRQNMGSALLELGADEAEALLTETALACDCLGLAHLATSTSINLAMIALRRGDLERAEARLRETLEDLHVRRERRLETYVHAYLALVEQRRGRIDAMLEAARRSVEIAPERLSAQVFAIGTLAAALLAAGRIDEARAASQRTIDLLHELGGVEAGEASIRLNHAEILLAAGERDAALAAFAEARDWLLERAAKIRDEGRRGTFLGNIAEHARTLDRAGEVLGPDARPPTRPG